MGRVFSSQVAADPARFWRHASADAHRLLAGPAGRRRRKILQAVPHTRTITFPPSVSTRHSITESPRRLAFISAVVSFGGLASTASGIPILWVEGEYLRRADQVIAWFRLLPDFANPQGGLHAFSQSMIEKYWMFI